MVNFFKLRKLNNWRLLNNIFCLKSTSFIGHSFPVLTARQVKKVEKAEMEANNINFKSFSTSMFRGYFASNKNIFLGLSNSVVLVFFPADRFKMFVSDILLQKKTGNTNFFAGVQAVFGIFALSYKFLKLTKKYFFYPFALPIIFTEILIATRSYLSLRCNFFFNGFESFFC